jgi:Transposase DDE domain group 1
LSRTKSSNQKGTSVVKRSRRRPGLKSTGGGTGIVNHAGARLLADLADAVGLPAAMSRAMAPTKQRRRGHDRGEVLVDVAVMIADGGDTISDVAVLRDQPDLFGDVASHATVWRTLEAVDGAALERIKTARAAARARAWAAGADPGFYVIDVDATLIGAHSGKEQAAPNYKRGFGFHPLLAYLDGTGEALAGLLRPGNAGSGTAVDHVAVLDDALAQLPIDPAHVEVIVRADSAGWSHGFVEGCRERHVRFVIGHQLTVDIASVLVDVPERAWQPAISADGSELREHAEVVEITDLVDFARWPPGCRMIVRREDPHPGAQLTFTDVDGHRFQVFVTDLADTDIAYLEALYRGRGRAERQICDTKATGLGNLPSHSFAINQAWLQLALVAHDLLAWTRRLVVDGDLATAEPKRLRYCLFHTAGQIITTGRRRICRLSATWTWTDELVAAFTRVHTHPLRS